MSLEYTTDITDILKGIYQIDEKADMAVRMLAETSSKQLESIAKEDAPWVDRTGQARKRLRGYVEEHPNHYRIVLAHGVDYGIWLELANEKNYAIIEPTIRLKSSEIMKNFSNLMEKIGY